MLRIKYRDFEFRDTRREVISVKGALHQAMISDALSADECTLTVIYNPAALGYYITDASSGSGFLYTVNSEIYMCRTTDTETIDGNLEPFEGGFVNAQPVDIYEDDTFFKRFYVTEALPLRLNRDGSVVIQLKAISFIGLTVYMSHNGGIYSNSTVGAVMAEILGATKNNTKSTTTLYWYDIGDLHYTIDATVAKTRADGYLPITDRSRTARDNIRDVCFGYGISVLQTSDGSVHFTFSQPVDVINIPDEEIYSGDAYSRHQALTAVKVIANTYRQYSGEDAIILWEGVQTVSGSKVIFDEPCWGLYSSQEGGADTITIEESGVNYAIISGSGTLYGIPYLHTQEEFSKTIGAGVENVKTASCGMVTLLNYQNVLERMANYYGNAREVSASFVVKDGVSTGSLVSFNDPLRRAKTGYINELAFVMSGIVKGDAKVTANWLPSDVGNNFTMSQVLTGTGTWSKAAAEALVDHSIDLVRIDLIGGGSGGDPGEDGEAGSTGKGGKGGNAGSGGLAGKVFSVTLEGDQIPASLTFSCGAAGQPGAAGGASTITANGSTYSSDAGVRTPAGYMDLIDGTVRATLGPDGIAGGRGGNYQGLDSTVEDLTGESVSYKGRTWAAGAFGAGEYDYRYTPVKASWGWTVDRNSKTEVSAAAGSSGGAAFGQSSETAAGGKLGLEYKLGALAVGYKAAGSSVSSKGANAQPIDDYTPSLGSGGAGGNGGGGGGSQNRSYGAGGYMPDSGGTDVKYVPVTNPTNGEGQAGAGGTGSLGTVGGAGFITIYF